VSIFARHIATSSVILILCGIFFIESLNYPNHVALLPQILIILISLLAIGMSVEYYYKNKKAENNENENNENENNENEKVNLKDLFIMGGLTLVYILTIDFLGYFIVTPLFIFISLIYLKASKFITAILISLIIPLFIYVIFRTFLNIPIPMGVFS